MDKLRSILQCGRRADDLERDAHRALDRVERETAKLEQASKKLAEAEDPIAAFVHGINHNRQRDIVRRGE